MRYISDNKELKKISIYTNIEKGKEFLKKFFYEIKEYEKDDKVKVAVIDSSEPFFTKRVNNSEIIFDMSGNYPHSPRHLICRGIENYSLSKSDLWMEFINNIFSLENVRDEFDICKFFERICKFKKINIDKYLLTEDILKNTATYISKIGTRDRHTEFLFIIFNANVNLFQKTRQNIIESIESKYEIKCFFKTSSYLFDDKITIGYIYKVSNMT